MGRDGRRGVATSPGSWRCGEGSCPRAAEGARPCHTQISDFGLQTGGEQRIAVIWGPWFAANCASSATCVFSPGSGPSASHLKLETTSPRGACLPAATSPSSRLAVPHPPWAVASPGSVLGAALCGKAFFLTNPLPPSPPPKPGTSLPDSGLSMCAGGTQDPAPGPLIPLLRRVLSCGHHRPKPSS